VTKSQACSGKKGGRVLEHYRAFTIEAYNMIDRFFLYVKAEIVGLHSAFWNAREGKPFHVGCDFVSAY